MAGHGLSVVAGGHCDHASGALGGREERELVRRPPLLEAAGRLEDLVLEENRCAYAMANRLGGQRRRAYDTAGDPSGRRLDVLQRNYGFCLRRT